MILIAIEVDSYSNQIDFIDTPNQLHIIFSFLWKKFLTIFLFFSENKFSGAKTEAGQSATLACAIVGSPSAPSEIYWVDGTDANVKYTSSSMSNEKT